MTRTLAYLDGGSAALVLQMIAGVAAALAVTLKLYGRKIKRFVLRSGADESDTQAMTQQDSR